jgi:hypothetical protein
VQQQQGDASRKDFFPAKPEKMKAVNPVGNLEGNKNRRYVTNETKYANRALNTSND